MPPTEPEGKGFGWYYANAILEAVRTVAGMESAERVEMPSDSLYHQQKNQRRVLQLEALVAELRQQLAMGPVVEFLRLKSDALDGVDLSQEVLDSLPADGPGHSVVAQFRAEQKRYKVLAEERNLLFEALEEEEHQLEIERALHHQTKCQLAELRDLQDSALELREAFEQCQNKLIREQKSHRAECDKNAQLEHACKKYQMQVAGMQKQLDEVLTAQREAVMHQQRVAQAQQSQQAETERLAAQKDSEVQALRRDLEESTAAARQAQKQARELQAALDDSTARVAAQDNKIKLLEADVKAQVAFVDQVSAQKRKVEEDMVKVATDLRSTNAANEEAARDGAQRSVAFQTLQTEVTTLKDQLARMQAAAQGEATKAATAQSALETSLKERSAEVAQTKKQLTEAEAQAEKQLAEAATHAKSLDAAKSKLEASLKESTSAADKLAKDVAQKEKEAAAQAKAFAAKEGELAALRKDMDAKVDAAEADRDEAQSALASKGAELEDVRDECEGLQKENADMRREAECLLQEAENTQGELDALKEENAAKGRALEEASGRLEKATADLAALNKEKIRAESKNLDDLREMAARMKADRDKELKASSTLAADLAAAAQRNEDHDAAVKVYEKKIDELKQTVDLRNQKIELLEGNLKREEEKQTEIKAMHTKSTRKLERMYDDKVKLNEQHYKEQNKREKEALEMRLKEKEKELAKRNAHPLVTKDQLEDMHANHLAVMKQATVLKVRSQRERHESAQYRNELYRLQKIKASYYETDMTESPRPEPRDSVGIQANEAGTKRRRLGLGPAAHAYPGAGGDEAASQS